MGSRDKLTENIVVKYSSIDIDKLPSFIENIKVKETELFICKFQIQTHISTRDLEIFKGSEKTILKAL